MVVSLWLTTGTVICDGPVSGNKAYAVMQRALENRRNEYVYSQHHLTVSDFLPSTHDPSAHKIQTRAFEDDVLNMFRTVHSLKMLGSLKMLQVKNA